MHALRRRAVLLSGRLLPQADAVHQVPGAIVHVRLLLPQADAMHAMFVFPVLSGRLLPEAVPDVLLVCKQREPSLSAVVRRSGHRM